MAEDRVERRLTTILAADVVGYSRLMAADEVGTLTSLKAIRREFFEPKTTEHQGRGELSSYMHARVLLRILHEIGD